MQKEDYIVQKINISLKKIPLIKEPIALCLGNFDGLHLGHQRLIKEALLKEEISVAVLSFTNPLGEIISLRKATTLLTSIDDRGEFLNKLGVSYLLTMEFNKELRDLKAIDFIELILKKLNIQHIYVGRDYRFGKNIEGDLHLLRKHFPLTVLNLMEDNLGKISTSRIIELIKNGQIAKANELLGRAYKIKGKVIKGFQKGRLIGYPTANLELLAPYVLPLNGVYKTIAYLNGFPYLAITNVGVHPTLNKLENPIIETHLLNYDKDTYEEVIELEFLSFLREEKTFNSLKELKEQISLDLKNF
jgi:riboflavin kinase/FMN adenylyltransferase